ncbi:heme-binding protein [Arthrobacter sp. I2-34]|uniref:Heme-binding protein n=1 Tax=Arthrobacter hankyongi TaxID=2904801 RepID=A0ABS9L8V4_9MICC|nr:heme-binding protein [Arthrobacter hankyongi]MCG2623116.1 heme-binding protein [Arthrobacter hankyongi]
MTLTLTQANLIIDSAISKAKELDIRISVSVCDAGGRLLAFGRMDGGHWGAGYGSQGKAVAAAGFAKPSGLLAERAASPIMIGIAQAEGGHIFYAKGAVPIFADGVLVGACGVGGGTGEQDEECAGAGVAALQAISVLQG